MPRPRPEDAARFLLPTLQRKVERLETRLKLLEEELRGGIKLSQFYTSDKERAAGSGGWAVENGGWVVENAACGFAPTPAGVFTGG